MDLTTATPVEIDTVLASLYHVESGLIAQVEAYEARARSTAGIYLHGVDREPSRFDTTPPVKGTTEQAMAILQAKIDADPEPSYRYSDSAYAASAVKAVTEAREALAANQAEQAPLHAEFSRRGGWSRSFVAKHAHSSMHCSTCNNGIRPTRFGWLPQVSGMTEAEIVTALGSDACTVCYPSAPVDTAPSRSVLTITEQEAQDARDAKAAKKAAADAKKAAKALVIDLRPFGVDGYEARIETVTAAKGYLTDAVQWNGWLASEGRRHPSYPAAAEQAVAEALAAKFGTTPEQEVADAVKRAAKRK